LERKGIRREPAMDINFHYFAVKAIACTSGFEEEEAQMIADYSQFVDDFNLYAYIWLSEVPEFARYLSKEILPGLYCFNPVTT
jgi:hypothetical protein